MSRETSLQELASVVRSSVISRQHATLEKVIDDYKNITGYDIPYREFGYHSSLALLKDICGIIVEENEWSVIIHAESQKAQHIADLVKKQKPDVKKEKRYVKKSSPGFSPLRSRYRDAYRYRKSFNGKGYEDQRPHRTLPATFGHRKYATSRRDAAHIDNYFDSDDWKEEAEEDEENLSSFANLTLASRVGDYSSKRSSVSSCGSYQKYYMRLIPTERDDDGTWKRLVKVTNDDEMSIVVQNSPDVLPINSSEWKDGPTFHGHCFIGDDFLLSFSVESLCANYSDNDFPSSGLCVSGQTLTHFYKRINLSSKLPSTKILLMLGYVDILKGTSVSTMKATVMNIIGHVQVYSEKIVMLTLPHFGHYDADHLNKRVDEFNKFLLLCKSFNSVSVLKAHELFMDEDGEINMELYDRIPRVVSGVQQPVLHWTMKGRHRLYNFLLQYLQ